MPSSIPSGVSIGLAELATVRHAYNVAGSEVLHHWVVLGLCVMTVL